MTRYRTTLAIQIRVKYRHLSVHDNSNVAKSVNDCQIGQKLKPKSENKHIICYLVFDNDISSFGQSVEYWPDSILFQT